MRAFLNLMVQTSGVGSVTGISWSEKSETVDGRQDAILIERLQTRQCARVKDSGKGEDRNAIESGRRAELAFEQTGKV